MPTAARRTRSAPVIDIVVASPLWRNEPRAAAVILDEAQNTTAMQMKMFLTRLGENSRMIVTGDPSQVDLPPGQTSGLAEAVRLLADLEGIGHVIFTHEDVVRHQLVARIVAAYEEATAAAPKREGRD